MGNISHSNSRLTTQLQIHYDNRRHIHTALTTLSAAIRGRVEGARDRQRARFNGQPGLYTNSDMTVSDIQAQCILTPDAKQLLEVSVRKLHLSGRGYHRTLKLARTIADLAASERIEAVHVAEAVSLRPVQMIGG